MGSIISMLFFFHTMCEFIFYTVIYISFNHYVDFFVLTTRRLFESWHEGPALLLLLLFIPAHGEADNVATMWIPMTIAAQYWTRTFIIEMKIRIPMTTLIADHAAMQLISGHQHIHSRQHLESKSRLLN